MHWTNPVKDILWKLTQKEVKIQIVLYLLYKLNSQLKKTPGLKASLVNASKHLKKKLYHVICLHIDL